LEGHLQRPPEALYQRLHRPHGGATDARLPTATALRKSVTFNLIPQPIPEKADSGTIFPATPYTFAVTFVPARFNKLSLPDLVLITSYVWGLSTAAKFLLDPEGKS
jgi:hypothetical protein